MAHIIKCLLNANIYYFCWGNTKYKFNIDWYLHHYDILKLLFQKMLDYMEKNYFINKSMKESLLIQLENANFLKGKEIIDEEFDFYDPSNYGIY